jgi:hypothetical protein
MQFYVRSGVPTSRQGYFNSFYPTELFLDPRGTDGRLPTEYEANLSLAYNFNVGPVTITPQMYVFNVINKQIVTGIDERFNVFGNYVTNKNSPFFGQAGIEPGTTDPVSGVNCPASSQAPCSETWTTARPSPAWEPGRFGRPSRSRFNGNRSFCSCLHTGRPMPPRFFVLHAGLPMSRVHFAAGGRKARPYDTEGWHRP